MPMIPGTAQPIPMDVPGPPSDANAGLIGTALSGFGEQLYHASSKVLDKLQEVEASDAVYAAKNADLTASEEQKAVLLKTSPDGYYRDPNTGEKVNNPGENGGYKTVTQAYRDWANERYQKTAESMPNPMAAQAYRKDGGQFFTTEMGTVFGQEQTRRVEASKTGMDIQVTAIADRMVSTPSTYQDMSKFYTDAQGTITRRLQSVKERVYDATTAQQLTKDDLSKMAQANMSGYIQAILDNSRNGSPGYDSLGEVRKAIAVLDEQDPASVYRNKNGLFTLGSVLTPTQKEELRNRLLSISQTTVQYDLATWRRGIVDASGIARKTGQGAVFYKKFEAEGRKFVQSGQLSMEQMHSEAAAPIYEAVKRNIESDWWALKPEAERNASIEKQARATIALVQQDMPNTLEGSVVGGKIVGEAFAASNQANDSLTADYKRDSAAYVVKHDRDLQAKQDKLIQMGPGQWNAANLGVYLDRVASQVKISGPGKVSEWRTVPKDFSDYAGAQLSSPAQGDVKSSIENRAFMVKQMYRSSPKQWGAFINQMVKDKSVPVEFQFLKVMPNPTIAREFMATFMVDKSTFSDQFNKSFAAGDNSTNFEKFSKDSLVTPMQQWSNHVAQQYSFDPAMAGMSKTLNEFFSVKAAQIYMASGGKMTPSEAGDQAFKALIGNGSSVTQSSTGSTWNPMTWTDPADKTYIFRSYPNHMNDGTVITSETTARLDAFANEKVKDTNFIHYIGASPSAQYYRLQQARGVSPKDAKELWTQQILKSGRLVNDSHGREGFQLIYKDSLNSSPQIATDQAGIPIFVPWNQALRVAKSATQQPPAKKAPDKPMPTEKVKPKAGKFQ